jgi:hypothetical protein
VIDGRTQRRQRRVGQLLHREFRQQALKVLQWRIAPLQLIEFFVERASLLLSRYQSARPQ